MEGIKGKHFSITDPQGVNTVIYRILKTQKEQQIQNAPRYTAERLEYAEEFRGELKKKIFFIDEPDSAGEDLLILSFAKEKVVVNMGFLNDNEIKIAKKPVPVKFNTLYSEKETVFKEFKYTPNLKRSISIIDPETAEEIKPTLYFDKETNEVKGKCKLKPYKSYFAFEIREKKGD